MTSFSPPPPRRATAVGPPGASVPRGAPGSGRGALYLAILLAIAYLGVFLWASLRESYDLIGGLAVAPAVLLIAIPLVLSLARREDDLVVRRIVVASIGLKVLATIIRYYVVFGLYGGSADAARYHGAGSTIAPMIRSFDVGWLTGQNWIGTPALELLTGIVYAAIGPTRIGGFFVFSAMAWTGVYLLWRAADRAVPNLNRRRYAALLFLLPSVLYWPASIGKESWMVLVIGVASYGTALLATGKKLGVIALVAGVLGAAVVRPHMAVMLLAALAGALILSRSTRGGLRASTRVLAAITVVVLGIWVAEQTQQFFGIDALDTRALGEVFDDTAAQTATGGSQFDNFYVSNPLLFPAAFISVIFRPFPFEAGNFQSLLLSLEGILLLALGWRFRSSWRALLPTAMRSPYVAYVVVFTIAFVIAFSTFNNFGLLARERVMVYPFFLLWLSLIPLRRPSTVAHRAKPAASEPGLRS
jgi:hypothetical protein